MEPLRRKRLVAPFDRKANSSREYYVLVSPESASRKAVADFMAWLMEEVRLDSGILLGGHAAKQAQAGKTATWRSRKPSVAGH